MEITPIRASIKAFALLGFWAIFALAYFQRFPFPGFFPNLFLFLLALVVTASAAGYGLWIGSRLWPVGLTRTERLIFSLGLGWGILSLAMAGLGLVGAWTRLGGVGLVALGVLLGGNAVHWFHGRLQDLHAGRFDVPPMALGLIVLSAVLSLLLAYVPVTYYDSLVYHFALPQTYQQAHHWVALPELIYSAFPQNLEMLWLLGMLLANDTLANLLGWMISASLVAAVFCLTRRLADRRAAWWASALFFTMPALLLLSSGGYVDVGLAFFSFLSLYAVILWRQAPQTQTIFLAGLFGGLAMGIKYTGAFGVFAGLVVLFTAEFRSALRRNISHALIYLGAAYLVFLPWLIKNLFVMGNPVFPFFHQWSLLQLNPWVGEAAAGYFFHGLTEYESRSALQLLHVFWDIAVNGMEFGRGMDVLGDLGWAPLVALLPAVWLTTPLRSIAKWLLLYAAAFYIPWAMTRPVLRFLIPLAPVLASLAGEAWTHGITMIRSPLFSSVARGLIVGLIVSGFSLFFYTTGLLGSFRVIFGLDSRDSYLASKLNYFAAAQFINTLPDTSLTYVIGDQRGYYYDRSVIVTPVFNRNPLTDWANRAATPDALVRVLKAQEITHLLINHLEMARLEPYRIFPFTNQGRRNWDGLRQRMGKTVYRDSACEVIEL